MSSPIIVVTALIKNPTKDKLLIVKRKSSSLIHPNLWMFPGGKSEKGEDILEALKREVKEETNLEIFNLKKISEYEYIRPNKTLTFGQCFSAISSSEGIILNTKELESFAWVSPKEFKNYPHLKELDFEVKKAFSQLPKSI